MADTNNDFEEVSLTVDDNQPPASTSISSSSPSAKVTTKSPICDLQSGSAVPRSETISSQDDHIASISNNNMTGTSTLSSSLKLPLSTSNNNSSTIPRSFSPAVLMVISDDDAGEVDLGNPSTSAASNNNNNSQNMIDHKLLTALNLDDDGDVTEIMSPISVHSMDSGLRHAVNSANQRMVKTIDDAAPVGVPDPIPSTTEPTLPTTATANLHVDVLDDGFDTVGMMQSAGVISPHDKYGMGSTPTTRSNRPYSVDGRVEGWDQKVFLTPSGVVGGSGGQDYVNETSVEGVDMVRSLSTSAGGVVERDDLQEDVDGHHGSTIQTQSQSQQPKGPPPPVDTVDEATRISADKTIPTTETTTNEAIQTPPSNTTSTSTSPTSPHTPPAQVPQQPLTFTAQLRHSPHSLDSVMRSLAQELMIPVTQLRKEGSLSPWDAADLLTDADALIHLDVGGTNTLPRRKASVVAGIQGSGTGSTGSTNNMIPGGYIGSHHVQSSWARDVMRVGVSLLSGAVSAPFGSLEREARVKDSVDFFKVTLQVWRGSPSKAKRFVKSLQGGWYKKGMTMQELADKIPDDKWWFRRSSK
ncbi:hypothetical protein HDU76_013340 [Blyttiomyces sp. JEL0837]|nr:hypothetical protein HDU76_013340 [Blyttiomyces sp. JEL0837]